MDHIRQPTHCSITYLALVIAVGIFACTSAFAADGEESWQPPPPMPDEFDWVQMTSGEWLKGEIIAMYEDTFEFEIRPGAWCQLVELADHHLIADGVHDPTAIGR